jgi:hypothetical protein
MFRCPKSGRGRSFEVGSGGGFDTAQEGRGSGWRKTVGMPEECSHDAR